MPMLRLKALLFIASLAIVMTPCNTAWKRRSHVIDQRTRPQVLTRSPKQRFHSQFSTKCRNDVSGPDGSGAWAAGTICKSAYLLGSPSDSCNRSANDRSAVVAA